jgi:isoleucyl-tRNA synthetase
VQTTLYEMTRTLATWMAPVLCFTAQDVADELSRVTGEPFDVHASVRGELYPPGKAPVNPNKRWTDEIRPRREAILRPLEKFRAEGHKSLDARVRVTPAAAERPHWQWNLDHLSELSVVSRVELDPTDAPAGAETSVVVDEAPWSSCPRCWRRTGDAPTPGAPDPNLCQRCAAAVSTGLRSD